MASVGSIKLIDKAISAIEISEATSTELGQTDFVGLLTVKNIVSPVAGKIQHSPDKVTWFDLVTFSGLSSDGAEIQPVTGPVLSNVRCEVIGEGDVACELRFDRRGK